MKTDIRKEMIVAKARGVPLVIISTPDQLATTSNLVETFDTITRADGKRTFRCPLLKWDLLDGIQPLNEMGTLALMHTFGGRQMAKTGFDLLTKPDREPADYNQFLKLYEGIKPGIKEKTLKPYTALQAALELPEDTVLFMLNFQRLLDKSAQTMPLNIQALINLRNPYKNGMTMWDLSLTQETATHARSTRTRMVVLLVPQEESLPPELRQDFVVLEEELPTEDKRREIITGIFEGSGVDITDDEIIRRAVDATKGMAEFPIEQETALSFTSTGLDIDRLAQRAIKSINQQPGLTVWEGNENFDTHIGGNTNVIAYLKRVCENNRPGSVIFADELDKSVAGASNSPGSGTQDAGTSAGMHGELLKWIVDAGVYCILFIGCGGTGKSLLAKATGNYAGIKTIAFELQAMKSQYQGIAVQNIRNACRTAIAYSPRYPLFIGTCNNPDALSPELMSRMAVKFYFPLPFKPELDMIWKIQMKSKQLPEQPYPQTDGFTGRDIMNICLNAQLTKDTVISAAQYITPAKVTDAEEIARLDRIAELRGYICAAYPGAFRAGYDPTEVIAAPSKNSGKRTITNLSV